MPKGLAAAWMCSLSLAAALSLAASPAGGPEPPRIDGHARRDALPWSAQLTPLSADIGAAGSARAGGDLRAALEALDRHHPGGAAGDARHLLRGVVLVQLGREAEALVDLRAALKARPELSDVTSFYLGQAMAAAGQGEAAAALLRGVPSSSPWGLGCALEAARIDIREGRLTQALEALTSLKGAAGWEKAPPDAALLSAQALEQRAGAGDIEEALGLYQTLTLTSPLSGAGRAARDRLSALAAQDKAPPSPTPSQLYGQARVYLSAHLNDTAADKLTALLATLPEGDILRCDVGLDLGRALQKERRYSDSLPVLTQVDRDGCLDEDRVVALFLSARAYARKGEQRSALAAYADLAARFPQHSMADDALYLSGTLHLEEGRAAEAERLFTEQLQRFPTGDMASDGAWRLGWTYYRQGRLTDALPTLDAQAMSTTTPIGARLQAQYWTARWRLASTDGGERTRGLEDLRALALRAPLHWYGLLAARQLAAVDPAALSSIRRVPLTPTREHPDVSTLGSHLARASWLVRAGLPDLARQLLTFHDVGTLPDKEQQLTAFLLERMGLFGPSHQIARRYVEATDVTAPTPEGLLWLLLAFPPAWEDIVRREAAAGGYDPLLLMALMREESAFVPDIRSWAGALGLTQLMWPTAREVARKIGVSLPNQEALFDPATNVRIGASFLGSLLERFSGRAGLAVPGYNAGAGSVNRWLSERPTLPYDEWVEEIPYTQTRDYVKRVIGTYQIYHHLYGQGSPFVELPLDLPARAEPNK